MAGSLVACCIAFMVCRLFMAVSLALLTLSLCVLLQMSTCKRSMVYRKPDFAKGVNDRTAPRKVCVMESLKAGTFDKCKALRNRRRETFCKMWKTASLVSILWHCTVSLRSPLQMTTCCLSLNRMLIIKMNT